MQVGLYFGSFNPIHIGHLILANYIVEHSSLDKLWFVVSPHNPLKLKKTLLADHHRLELVYRACELYDKLEVSDIEFKLKQPSYTVVTLIHLKERHPNHYFTLIMGQDSLQSLPKWKNYEVLLEDYRILVYPRVSAGKPFDSSLSNHPSVSLLSAPIIELSATAIRKDIQENRNVRPYLPDGVWEYIDEMNFYKN